MPSYLIFACYLATRAFHLLLQEGLILKPFNQNLYLIGVVHHLLIVRTSKISNRKCLINFEFISDSECMHVCMNSKFTTFAAVIKAI